MVFQGHNYISCLSTLNDINNSQLFWSRSPGILVIKTIFTNMEQTNHVQTKQTIIILPASIKFIQKKSMSEVDLDTKREVKEVMHGKMEIK